MFKQLRTKIQIRHMLNIVYLQTFLNLDYFAACFHFETVSIFVTLIQRTERTQRSRKLFPCAVPRKSSSYIIAKTVKIKLFQRSIIKKCNVTANIRKDTNLLFVYQCRKVEFEICLASGAPWHQSFISISSATDLLPTSVTL